jgi:hypothetical protein
MFRFKDTAPGQITLETAVRRLWGCWMVGPGLFCSSPPLSRHEPWSLSMVPSISMLTLRRTARRN